MRSFSLALAVALATCVVACGGDGGNESEAAQPLTLFQRIVNESDAPDSRPDPVETRLTARSLDDLRGWGDEGIAAAQVDPRELEALGFLAAIHDTRFFPKEPGGPHRGDAPHVRSLVGQFESAEAARKTLELLYEGALTPCPGRCAASFEKFDVSGMPDAKGVRRLVTAERLDQLQEPGEPSDSYTIVFADGPYAYAVELFGPPGEVSQDQLEEIVGNLHHRVEGAPAPAAG